LGSVSSLVSEKKIFEISAIGGINFPMKYVPKSRNKFLVHLDPKGSR
jgi:hypothetical protein